MEARLYIGNLSADVQASDLLELLMEKKLKADVTVPNLFGRGRGYAFAQFDTAGSAKAAIEILDGCEFQRRRLVVRQALRPIAV
jgi:RNA recognition motif-containing protein